MRRTSTGKVTAPASPPGQTLLTFTPPGSPKQASPPSVPYKPPGVPGRDYAMPPKTTKQDYAPVTPPKRAPTLSFVPETPESPAPPPAKTIKTRPISASDDEAKDEYDEANDEFVENSNPPSPVKPLAPRQLFAAKPSRSKPSKPRKTRKNRPIDFKMGIYKVNKQVQGEHARNLSAKSMDIVNSFVVDFMTRIAEEARLLAEKTRKKTLSSREIQTAVRLVIPGYGQEKSLCEHATMEGTKAVTRWACSGGLR